MNVGHHIGVLHSFSIKNIFYDKIDLRVSYAELTDHESWLILQNCPVKSKFTTKTRLLSEACLTQYIYFKYLNKLHGHTINLQPKLRHCRTT